MGVKDWDMACQWMGKRMKNKAVADVCASG